LPIPAKARLGLLRVAGDYSLKVLRRKELALGLLCSENSLLE
jgi:hypothetical protein